MARRRLLILLAVQAAAFWPVWRWASLRVADGDSDEIVALAACAAALLIAPQQASHREGAKRPWRTRGASQRRAPTSWSGRSAKRTAAESTRCSRLLRRFAPRNDGRVAFRAVGAADGHSQEISAPSLLLLPVLLTLAYAASVLVAPPVLRAAVASCALLATWCAWRWGAPPHPAAMGLAVLALPALPTAQFMLGYPLRVVVGEVAARLLALAGFAVERDGVSLRAGERLVAIDAPCSGVNMLWTALLLALVLAALAGLSWPRTALLAAAAATLAVAGNGLRAASLFLVETGAVPVPPRLDADAVHAALGVVAFALIAMPLLWTCSRWQAAVTS